MRMARSSAVVFTDLDATLLDHHDYSWQQAGQALALLRAHDVPVCIVTSKTVAEVQALRCELGNAYPFATENGGAVAVPQGYFEGARCDANTPLEVITLGAEREILRALVERLRAKHGFRFAGFGDMSVEDVIDATGLDRDAAAKALERAASEPLLWQDSEDALDTFCRAVEAAGLTVRVGGRFVHVLGQADKGDAVRWLRARYERAHGPILAVALGDSGNDTDMLEAADIGYWVARPDGSYYGPALGSIRHARGIGPAGWAEAIEALVANHEI